MNFIRLAALTAALLFAHAVSAAPIVIDLSDADDTPAFNAAITEACASTETRTIKIPVGVANLYSKPMDIACSASLEGEGVGVTRVIRHYSNNAVFNFVRGADQSGGWVSKMSILAGPGTQNGVAILVTATQDTDCSVNSLNRHSFRVDDVQIGRSSLDGQNFSTGIYFDGSANRPDNRLDTNGNACAPGIRAPLVRATTISGFTSSAIYLNRARNVNLEIECFIPLGSAYNGVYAQNATYNVVLKSFGCGLRSVDHTALDMRLVSFTTVAP